MKVHIPNLPTRFDIATQTDIPTIDLNSAARFGELITHTRGFINSADAQEWIDAFLDGPLDVSEDDCILCFGDGALLTAMTMRAVHENGKATLLRWDRARGDYDKLEVSL